MTRISAQNGNLVIMTKCQLLQAFSPTFGTTSTLIEFTSVEKKKKEMASCHGDSPGEEEILM